MHLPILRNEKRYRRQIINFGGLNTTQSFSDGELSDCSGISHIAFPALTQRQKSENTFSCRGISAAIFANKECIASNEGLYYDRKKVGELSEGEKQLSFMGNKVIVFPDKMYYDTKTNEFSSLEAKSVLSDMEVVFSENSITVPESKYIETFEVGTISFPKDAKLITYDSVTKNENGSLSLNNFELKEVSALSENTIICEKCEKNQYRIVISIEYSQENQTYTVMNNLITYKNVLKNIFSGYKAGDVIEISGCKKIKSNNKMATLVSVSKTCLVFADKSFSVATETEEVTLKRKIPDFTCVCSYENRLWGCEGNTIYASVLGDPTNFFIYKNLSTDSFTIESNTTGDFTSCVSYGNYCLFFKENACFKLYGNKPSNFQLTESFGSGIPKTEKKSIAVFNGKMFYNGNGGIYSFFGGIPTCISQKIEGLSLKNASAGCDGKRYYISADTFSGREEFVYDIQKGLWSKSGRKDIKGYFYNEGKIHCFTEEGIFAIEEEPDEKALWEAVFCPFNEDYYKTKNYLRLHICVRLFENAWICVEEKTDNSSWRVVAKEYGSDKKHMSIPFSVKGCHETQIRLSGKGKCMIESLTREFSVN